MQEPLHLRSAIPPALQFLPDAKANVFTESFFPPPPAADLDDFNDFEYPEPVKVPDITPDEVRNAIRRPGPLKVPGPDQKPNLTLQAAAVPDGKFQSLLARIYYACLQIGYCPTHFREKLERLPLPNQARTTTPRPNRTAQSNR